jgi:uncharacterized protein (DUF1697 family)
MSIYIALLRGINVSGQRLIKMGDLKRVFESLGLRRVQTYIQSGNVLFESDEAEAPLRQRIEQEIEAVFGFAVPVVLRTAGELAQILAGCPWAAGDRYVALLAEAPSQAGIDRLLAYKSEIDEFRIAGREVYLLLRQGAGRTKLTNNLLEQKLGVAATTRNWQTLQKLAAMGKAMMVE